MLTKQYNTRVRLTKDAEGKPTGEVTAVVSVFGNVDVVGDRVVKGAFAKTLEDYKASGDPIPMIWSHDWSNPMSHIGSWDSSKAVETDEGLELTGKVDINSGNPIADQAYKLMDRRLVKEFSFAYDVQDEAKADDGANELKALTLIEAGPTLKGANSETRLVAAKALGKVGRALSAKNEATLREAHDAIVVGVGSIKAVLSALGEDGKSDDPVTDLLDTPDLLVKEDEGNAPDSEDDAHPLAPVVDALKAAVDGITSYITPKSDDGSEPDDDASSEPEPIVAPKSIEQDDVLRQLFLLENE